MTRDQLCDECQVRYDRHETYCDACSLISNTDGFVECAECQEFNPDNFEPCDDCRQNESERVYERQCADYYGGDGPQTLHEQAVAARALK